MHEEHAASQIFNDILKRKADRMFYGYCFEEVNGKYMPPVKLDGPQEAWNYVRLQRLFFPEIRIVDHSDITNVHSKNGKIVFPIQWTLMECMSDLEELGDDQFNAEEYSIYLKSIGLTLQQPLESREQAQGLVEEHYKKIQPNHTNELR